MPEIIDYARVVTQAQRQGMRTLYHNSGAFGLSEDRPTYSVGWIGPTDATIRPAAIPLTRNLPPPFEANLSRAFERAWLGDLAGVMWILPKSSWMYEMEFGSSAWLPAALLDAAVDPQSLAKRHDGSAIAFNSSNRNDVIGAGGLVCALLTNLAGGDFAAMFPGRDIVATLHHHKQIWWTASDAGLIERLGELSAATYA